MLKLLVVADDITGALDTGAQFSKEGIRTFVASNVDVDFASVESGIEVLSVNSETRHKSPDEAYGIVFNLVKRAFEYGVTHIYKKTDSTLRGNIGCELLAALNGSGAKSLMFIPAFPDSGRTTKNGIQYIGDTPIAGTHFAKDPFTPVKESYIPDIIKEQADIETVVIKNNGIVDFADKRCIYIFDAKTNKEMTRIGGLLKESGEIRLTAGCAGFAGVLQNIIDFNRVKLPEFTYNENILLVSGSVNRTSLEQMRLAKEYGFNGKKLNPVQKLNPNYHKSAHCDEFVDDIRGILADNRLAYIEAVEHEDDMNQCLRYAEEAGIDDENSHLSIAQNIGEIIKKIVDVCDVRNLFVLGGDTLLGIMEKLEIKGVTPVAELCSGVVASKIISDKYAFNIITKSGGLGDANAVITVAERLL